MKTKASKLFTRECALLPMHHMHILARIITLRYLENYSTFNLHEKRINRALDRLDN